jgi:hypothetical protein
MNKSALIGYSFSSLSWVDQRGGWYFGEQGRRKRTNMGNRRAFRINSGLGMREERELHNAGVESVSPCSGRSPCQGGSYLARRI